MNINQIGDVDTRIKNSDKKELTITLKKVSYIPSFCTNIVSITTSINDYKSELGNKGRVITLKNPKTKETLEFWKIFPPEHGYIGELEVFKRIPNSTGSVNFKNKHKVQMDINEFQFRLRHPNYQVTKKTSDVYEIILKGIEKKCQNCDISKINVKNINKSNPNKSTIRGERIYTEISSVNSRSYGGNEYWILIEDESTRMKWSIFI